MVELRPCAAQLPTELFLKDKLRYMLPPSSGHSAAWIVPSRRTITRTPYISLLAIITLSSILNILALQKGHNWGDDFALYIAQGISLIEGKTEILLARNRFAMANSTYQIGPNLYPWGFPLILSPIYAFSGLNLSAMKITGIFFFELSLVVLFFLFHEKLELFSLLFLVSFFAFNPLFIKSNNNILSDMPYLFFSLLSIFMIERYIVQKRASNLEFIILCLVGLLISFAFFIRSVGFLLILLLAISQMISLTAYRGDGKQRIRNMKLFIIPYIVFVIFSAIAYLFLPSGSESYLSILSETRLSSSIDHFIYYLDLPSKFFGYQFSSIIYWLTIPFFLYGIYRHCRTDYLFLLYSALTLAILILWPYIQGIRFIFPILPFFIYFLCRGLEDFRPYFYIPGRKVVASIEATHVVMVTLIFLLLFHSVRLTYSNLTNEEIIKGPFTEESLEMFQFIKDNAEKESIIIFFKPRILGLLTGRNSVMNSDYGKILNGIGDYLVIYKDKGPHNQILYGSQEYERMTENCTKLFENTEFEIFRLKNVDNTH